MIHLHSRGTFRLRAYSMRTSCANPGHCQTAAMWRLEEGGGGKWRALTAQLDQTWAVASQSVHATASVTLYGEKTQRELLHAP